MRQRVVRLDGMSTGAAKSGKMNDERERVVSGATDVLTVEQCTCGAGVTVRRGNPWRL
jgi:hypothetical protein